MTSRRDRVVLTGAFAVVLGITAWISWTLFYGPDEVSHLTIVRHHAHHIEPASWEDWQYGGLRGHAYYLFSPVPYAVYIPFQWLAEWVGPVESAATPDYFVNRLGGLLIAAAQLALTIAIVRRLWRQCTLLQAAAVAVAANLIPGLRYLHAYVNADGVTILTVTACFALALRLVQRADITIADAVLVGLTLGLAAHGRYHGFVVPVALLLTFGVLVLRREKGYRIRFRLLGIAIALPVLLGGSFHLYVYDELENRHVLASLDNEELNDSTYQGSIPDARPLKELVLVRRRQVPDIWMGIWAWFPPYVYLRGLWLWILLLLSLGGVAGLVLQPNAVLSRNAQVIGLAAVAAVLGAWALMASQWLVGQYGKIMLPPGVTALAAIILGTGALLGRVPGLRADQGVLVAAGVWAALLGGLDVWAITRITAY
jgi:hypothetical protein